VVICYTVNGGTFIGNVSTWPAEPKTEAEYQAAITQLLDEMQRLNQVMQADQKEIDRLKTDTRRLLAETQAIKARTQARLDALAAMVLG